MVAVLAFLLILFLSLTLEKLTVYIHTACMLVLLGGFGWQPIGTQAYRFCLIAFKIEVSWAPETVLLSIF